MKINLKKALKEDIWDIINGNPPSKKDFKSLILHLLIESESFLIEDAMNLSNELEEKYNGILENINSYIRDEYGDVIKVLKVVNKCYVDRIQPILNKIEYYKVKLK